MATSAVFTLKNVALPAAPPTHYLPNANGLAVPTGHSSWLLVIDTTGLPAGQPLADFTVQYHYTNAVFLGGDSFTGWADDAEAPLNTTYTSKQGQTVFQAYLGADLNYIKGYYPDFARVLVTSSPGYASIPSVTLQLN